ncbi:chorion peroxidase [Eupeodes corollae]|uniref:chorion peroxidase n=1 Tax=Eupeodes corollae TaxID=290404 RepID=UPI00248FD0AF|nr:chorion peroxidase [Eupeodes corollae]XP_055904212.1 chorion peroxidase [Eupeodes corollae]
MSTSTETTPLTAAAAMAAAPPTGPSYVFPGVPSRSRRSQMRRFQCCMWTVFLGMIILALVIATNFSSYDPYTNSSTVHLLVDSDDLPMNSSDLFLLLMDIIDPIPDEEVIDWKFPAINASLQAEAEEFAVRALGDRELFEETISLTPVNTPAYRHYRSISTTPESRKLARRGYVEYHATLLIAKKFNYTKRPGRSNIGNGPRINLNDPTHFVKCDPKEKYRRANGTCNNKRNPRYYGAAYIPYRRQVAPDYGDGISAPRKSHTQKELPSARQVSLQVHRASYPTDSNFTVMLAVFGQFLDHDITATALTTSQDGESINCCTVPLSTHPECFPVPLERSDPFYTLYNATCMNFVRSAAAPTGIYGPRQQLNQATSFIDGSVVYGNSEQRQMSLRTRRNGTLRMYITHDGRELLPLSTNPDDGCNQEEMNSVGKYCFESGDDRSNENLLLTSMHLLFARHHNYLARGLQAVNPHWNDETVFQEARKIIGAQMQHITYNEFLPILLGKKLATKIGITSDPRSNVDTYDPKVDASIANNFASAAFRFAHTLLPSLFQATKDNSTQGSIELHKMLFNPYSLWAERGIDKAIELSVNNPVSRVDRFFSIELTEKLFEGTTTAEDRIPICGLDLVSLNIQRGRDHGLPSYPVFRKHCGFPSIKTWKDMEASIEPESLKSIREIYATPDDVDFYTGALSEPPIEGSIFGPVLTCIVSDQFLRIKKGDSHWYERKVGPQIFTPRQLKEIYKTKLARIICRNSDAIDRTRVLVMERRPSEENIFANCTELRNFNFSPWKEKIRSTNLTAVAFSNSETLIRVMTVVNSTMPPNFKL